MEESLENLADFPTVDLSHLRQNPLSKSLVIKKIHEACHTHGFFHVINHGVADSVIEEALNVNATFFEMGMEGKEGLLSDDIFQVVRYGEVQVGGFSRDFLKLYAHPLHHFLGSWPRLPHQYREKMGAYSTEIRKLGIELFGAIMESLNLGGETHLKDNFEKGIHMLGINCYPPSSGPHVKSGQPPHTDHSIITVLLQSAPGLEVFDRGSWKNVPELKGSLQVLVGDNLEVISNGLYKSVLHRAVPSRSTCSRLSIASLHSLAMDEVVEPAAKLLESDQENPTRYRGSSLRDFLNHLASRDTRPFLDTLKTKQVGP